MTAKGGDFMRLFFGISLPEQIRHAVSSRAAACRLQIPGRYVPEENYHITLAFLGNVPEAQTDDAVSVLSRCIRDLPPPLQTLGETSFFGRPQNAILIVRVLSEPSLDPLHHALVKSLEAASLPFDPGPFCAHITLARHAGIPEHLPSPQESISFIPDCAHLYLSARNEQNVLLYTPIASVPFSKPLAFPENPSK